MAELYPSYVVTPTHCKIKTLASTQIKSRRLLNAKLDNRFEKKILFILMNPSKVNKIDSDKRINKCAHISFYDLKKLRIGFFSVVNVYPFYESSSAKLNLALAAVQNASKRFYFKELIENLKTIYEEIQKSDYVFLCTGGIPEEITNKEEFKFLIDTIHSYVETLKGDVYLGKGDKNKGFIKDEKYSYHLCPNGNPKAINKMKLHKLTNGMFQDIPTQPIITLSEP